MNCKIFTGTYKQVEEEINYFFHTTRIQEIISVTQSIGIEEGRDYLAITLIYI